MEEKLWDFSAIGLFTKEKWSAFEILKERLKLELFLDIFAVFEFILNDFAICQYFPVTADLYLRSFKP